MLDGRGGLHRFDLEGGADVGERRGAKGERLGMMLLPALIFGPQIKGPRVLQIRGQHDGLVACLPGQLNAKIPGIERDEGKFEILGEQVFLHKGIKGVDGVPEGACLPNVLPGQCRQARCGLVSG